jgi:hypothetical protein
MVSEANMVRFPAPTHTHVFNNHDNGYGPFEHSQCANFGGSLKLGLANGFEDLPRVQAVVRS